MRYIRSAYHVKIFLFVREEARQKNEPLDLDTQYLEGQKLWRDLLSAAQQGNWMAVFLVTNALSIIDKGDNPITTARIAQLQGWMIKHDVADFYLQESGLFNKPYQSEGAIKLYIGTALRGSYTGMLHAGTALKNSSHPPDRAIGKKMHACVAKLMPQLLTD